MRSRHPTPRHNSFVPPLSSSHLTSLLAPSSPDNRTLLSLFQLAALTTHIPPVRGAPLHPYIFLSRWPNLTPPSHPGPRAAALNLRPPLPLLQEGSSGRTRRETIQTYGPAGIPSTNLKCFFSDFFFFFLR